MNALKSLSWLALIAQCVVLLAGCSRSDPERELRAAMADMQAAVVKKDTGAFMKFVADDFTRQSGGMTAKELRRTLTGVFLAQKSVSVSATVGEVTIDAKDKTRATVRITVLATGAQGMLPDTAQSWDMTAGFRREGGVWKVFNAEWKPLL